MVSFPAINPKAKNRLILVGLVGTFFLIFWALSTRFGSPFLSLSGENNLLVRFYDVGQGDAILIQKGTAQILIDGGPNNRILTYLGRDLLPWDREIELLVLTHPHADHLTGLISVLERYQVKQILYYPSRYDTKGYQKFLESIQNEGAKVFFASSGGSITVGEISLQILWPTANFHSDNVNNESLVMLLDYQEFEVLLLGDAEKDVQRSLSVNADIEVIKVAHQGSADGAGESLLRASKPELAVISVGAGNRYGHPHQQTLSLFDNYGIRVLRTDLDGAITVGSDGRGFWYDTDR